MHPLLNHYSPRQPQCCSHSLTSLEEEAWGCDGCLSRSPAPAALLCFPTQPHRLLQCQQRPGIHRHCAFCWITALFCNLFAKLIPNCWVHTFVNTFRLHTVNWTAIWAVSCIYLKLSALTPRVIYSTPFCEACYYTADGSAQNSIQK